MLVFMIASCGGDESPEEVASTVTISLDGVEQKVTNVIGEFNHKGTTNSNGVETKQALLGISVSTSTTITQIALGFSMLDNDQSSTCMAEGNFKEYDDAPAELEFYILGTIDGDFLDLRNVSSNEILATITSCNAANNTVSGSFSFEVEAEDFQSGGLTYYTVAGTFTDTKFIRTD